MRRICRLVSAVAVLTGIVILMLAGSAAAEGNEQAGKYTYVNISVINDADGAGLIEINDDQVPMAAAEAVSVLQARHVELAVILVLIAAGWMVILLGEKKKTKRMETDLKAQTVE